MKLIEAILEEIFRGEQCGGKTMAVTIHMVSPTACSGVDRFSTCGADQTKINFNPPLPLEYALLQARNYEEKGTFSHLG